MNASLWERLHGGSTHFPMVLLLASVGFDLIAQLSRDRSRRAGLHAAGLISAIVGVLGGCGAIISGLMMTEGQLLGTGLQRMHHLFVWPAFSIAVLLVGWRLFQRETLSPLNIRVYLGAMGLSSALMMGAGYWGGEMLLGHEDRSYCAHPSGCARSDKVSALRGHDLFLMNCAHCHGEDAKGTEEGPNLASRHRSNARIASVVNNGIKGQMPRFSEKLNHDDVQLLICFLRSVQGD